jgi:ABC-2 type transport system ATP-binding protein
VLTTHDMLEADELCDRIAIMEQGRIIALNTPVALKQQVASEQAIEVTARGLQPTLVDAIRSLPAATAADIVIDDPETDGGSVRVRSRDAEATTEALLRLLAARDVEVLGVASGEPTLEDVFFALTGRGLE